MPAEPFSSVCPRLHFPFEAARPSLSRVQGFHSFSLFAQLLDQVVLHADLFHEGEMLTHPVEMILLVHENS